MAARHEVLVIGGGNAGISLAARLRRYKVEDIGLVEPRTTHYFQPLFSHIGAGAARMSEAVRDQAKVMPRGVEWIRGSVADILPGENAVVLADGSRVGYGQLVVCPGLQLDWDGVPGLAEAMASPDVTSNYDPAMPGKTWALVRSLRYGTAVFTQPPGPAKCAGAAQKIAYMACDYWREQDVLRDIRVVLVVPTPTVFGVEGVDAVLDAKVAEYGIELRTGTILAGVDSARRTVSLAGPAGTEELAFDLLHVVPPQSAPDWLKSTALPAAGDGGGFVEVDPELLRHRRYPNVWSLGDAAATLNSKCGGALRKQVKVLAKNLKAVLAGREPQQRYNHYGVCPFTLTRHTVLFAEFDHQYRPMPTFPWLDPAKERRWAWVLDRRIFPQIYWHLILKGRA
ncbi:NAD(P)/FAD-dependent oxidoreductase [Arthrobacter sp. Marseille-P9274]|uniref:NAD(P)/FAD-dependent oxidoreductase n=1 Tax=Arthrobacter sp. Marseille-P9274 TaxID=2866572 RepID=UPI0021C82EAE|nr:FAD/NAD(P)-binding oxidoreductase [Arthrobacter sp. Marseille-P9274]